jgi:type IX secretion system substrate protein
MKKASFILWMVAWVLMTIPGMSQMLYSNNTDIRVVLTQITVQGGVTVDGTTSINNSGSITLTGDWINNSNNDCFGISQGTVELDGGNQNIGGTSETVFNNLNLLGSGVKTMNVDVTVGGGNIIPGGTLDFGSRYLDLNTNTLTISNSSAFSISRTSGYILSETDPIAGYGTLLWKTGNISGGSNYVFPFGVGSIAYIPVTFNFTTGSIGSPGTIAVSTYPTNTALSPNNRPLPTGLPVLTSYSGTENAANTLDRFWVIDVNGYTPALTADISFKYLDAEWLGGTNTITESALRAQRHDLIAWSQSMGTVNTTTNVATVSGVNNFNSIWALAGNASPLPIELLSFTAEAQDNKQVLCKWVTVSEINNDYFTVERSLDGFNFEEVGIVAGAGNSTATLEYQFTDKDPYFGLSYYRLKQTDYDGSNNWSQIVPVTLREKTSGGVSVYPNPSAGIYYINSDGAGYQIDRLQVYDLTGRIVVDKQSVNSQFSTLDMTGFANGIYTITVYANDEKETVKIVKQ